MNAIERYIVMPSQATAYKIGMIKLVELREKARQALGEKFDIREYHDVVLKNGAVPLDVLEQLVDDYIKAKKGWLCGTCSGALPLQAPFNPQI